MESWRREGGGDGESGNAASITCYGIKGTEEDPSPPPEMKATGTVQIHRVSHRIIIPTWAE